MSSEVKHYWPEEIVGTGELVVYLQDYAALEAENARLTTQLAAIQGGMGEAVGFDRNAAYAACPESGCDWGSFYVGWKAAAAQHQRITAAMAAEVKGRGAVATIEQREPYEGGAPNPGKTLRWAGNNAEDDFPTCTKLYALVPAPVKP